MTTSDPIRYPLPRGDVESLRQDIARTREQLAATVEQLAQRLDARRIVREQAQAAWTAGAPAVGAGAAFVTVYAAGRLATRRGRHPRLWGLASVAGGLAAGAAVYTAVKRARAPEEERQPAAVTVHSELSEVDRPDRAAPAVRDVVDVLLGQHRQLDELFGRVAAARGQDKLEEFAGLVSLLNRHEHAEQEVVHPALRQLGGGAAAAADARLAEERAADLALASLISRGVRHRTFARDLEKLREMVRAHGANEERDEFPLLRSRLSPADRQRMANQVNAALKSHEAY